MRETSDGSMLASTASCSWLIPRCSRRARMFDPRASNIAFLSIRRALLGILAKVHATAHAWRQRHVESGHLTRRKCDPFFFDAEAASDPDAEEPVLVPAGRRRDRGGTRRT